MPAPDKRLAIRIPVVCMWGHGTLTAYQDAADRIAVKPCEFCLNAAMVDQAKLDNQVWRKQVEEALG